MFACGTTVVGEFLVNCLNARNNQRNRNLVSVDNHQLETMLADYRRLQQYETWAFNQINALNADIEWYKQENNRVEANYNNADQLYMDLHNRYNFLAKESNHLNHQALIKTWMLQFALTGRQNSPEYAELCTIFQQFNADRKRNKFDTLDDYDARLKDLLGPNYRNP